MQDLEDGELVQERERVGVSRSGPRPPPQSVTPPPPCAASLRVYALLCTIGQSYSCMRP